MSGLASPEKARIVVGQLMLKLEHETAGRERECVGKGAQLTAQVELVRMAVSSDLCRTMKCAMQCAVKAMKTHRQDEEELPGAAHLLHELVSFCDRRIHLIEQPANIGLDVGCFAPE
jgi:hypothetical protein